MKSNFYDPTAEKWDQVPLTPEELKKVRRSVIILGIVLVIVSQVILCIL